MKEIKKYIEKIEDGETILYDNPEYIKYKVEKLYEVYLKKSGIPQFYWNINFEDYVGDKNSKSFKMIYNYANNILDKKYDFVNLYIQGVASTQKTALGINILKSAMKQGLRAKFILAGQLINKLMKLQSYSVDERIQEEVNLIRDADIILIDDIFDSEKSLYWKSESNSLIISEWDTFFRDMIAQGKKIILTSNFSLEIIQQKYGDYLYELIHRNFKEIELRDSVKEKRKLKVEGAFDDKQSD